MSARTWVFILLPVALLAAYVLWLAYRWSIKHPTTGERR